MTITTNEWTDAEKRKPWAKREVLVLMSDGTKRVLYWNGMYWVDPVTKIIQRWFDGGVHPVMFYVFEKPPKDVASV